MRDRHQPRARAEQLEELIEHELAAAVDRRHLERAAGLLAHHLPGHDVGVMLERGDQDLVARAEARPRIGLRDEIDRLGRAAHEDDLARRARVDEAAHALARRLEGVGGGLAERVHAAVHVGVRVRLVVLDGAQHRQRPLRGGGAVEVHERVPVDLAARIGKSRRTRSAS